MKSRLVLVVLALLYFPSSSRSDIVQFQPCPVPKKDALCSIHKLNVDPCPEAKDKKPCQITRGENASMVFDFTPKFEGEQIGARVYWASPLLDVPFLEMNSDGCLYTNCPLEKNKRQTFEYNLHIRESYPAGKYPIKWKVWNEKDEECCFMYAIVLN